MIDSSSDMVNLYNSRLKEVRIDDKIDETRQKLEQWRVECHQTIEKFYQRKLEELNSYLDQFRKQHEAKRNEIQKNITQLNSPENVDQTKSIIQKIDQDLNEIEQITLQIHLRSLTLNDNYIQIEKKFHFSNFKKESEISFSYSMESSSAIASNERFLLMHQYPYLNLIDHDHKNL